MPIYAYKCQSCGAARDVLQKLSDPPLTDCPVCGAAAFAKQVTAAGFQLKGGGWYVTDFKGGSGSAGSKSQGGNNDGATDGKSSAGEGGGKSDATTAAAASHACGPGCGCA